MPPGGAVLTVWGTVVNVVDGNRIVVQVVGSCDPVWIVGSQEAGGCIGGSADASLCGAINAQVDYQVVFGRLGYLEFDQHLRDADGTLLAYVHLDGGLRHGNAALVSLGLSRATVKPANERCSQVFLDLEEAVSQLGRGA